MGRPDDSSYKKDDRTNRKFLDRLSQQRGAAGHPDSGVRGREAQPSSKPAQEWQSGQSENVLVRHEKGQAPSSTDWMSQLKQNSVEFLEERDGKHMNAMYEESVYKTGIAVLVDKMFGLLQRYTFEFNQVAGGTDLNVSGTIAGDVTEVTRYNRRREAEATTTFFRCRFATRHCALTVRGHTDVVECFLLPVNQLMALSQMENEYKPICVIQVKISESGMMWRIKDSEPPIDTLDQLSMWLFQRLIEETKSYVDKAKEGKQ